MPDKPKYYQDYNELVELMKNSDHNYNYELIDRAYQLAEKMHGDQRRASGIPYILHPTTVACILVELGMDSESIAAALLHDVVEDTPVTLQEVTKMFGSEIANLIDGVTKLGKIPYSSREEQQAENIRKMLIAMSNDIRVIIIKLADRLHNMRTIECMKEQHRRDKALEVMEVYAPIAHRLGIRAIKEELEDLSIRYLDPVGYAEIEKQLELKSKDRLNFVSEIKQQLYDRLKDEISNVYIEGRVKSIHGIYKKTFMKGRTMDQIYDIFAVRVIVDSVADCYNVLGVVHDLFKPLPNRFKDYISTPKPNMYQSLHTTVIGKEGIPFEIQIRTWEMHYTAEYGIAAHWKYKEGITKKNSLDERLAWIRKMLENQSDNDSTDIVRTIKTDLVPEEVFVFTPKGDVLSLPTGATVIDVAYAIHSEVGNRMIGAKVDKRIVPIDYKVTTGEIVEIMTTKESGGPKRDWLNIVRTSEARSKIRLWFKREKRDENIQEGKAQLENEFKRLNISVPEKELPEFLADVMHRQNCNTIDDFYASIGYGGIQLWRILPRIKEEYFKKYTAAEPAPVVVKEPVPKKKVSSGVNIEGLDDCLVKYSRCCNPLPGDEIIGFITRGYGVSVHKRSCSNVPKDIEHSPEPERWVKAEWANTIVNETFKANLQISATDRTGLLADITNQLSAMHMFIHNLNSRETKNGVAIIEVSVTVNGINHLKMVISRLSGISGIVSIGRN
ncbi:MAG: bifunctional (p)ppGpp synthetase/guanosine-3',5'-bis(diphosphate) 3'-pyrophosphohydrolase [Clostridia bacterium]|nr:bifunctional (p)ppGpp synthetase/guanosine-3',5'-bis(diphosphate) 3'-pyrophosphohydrolase [Clostridia bacterium]